MFASLHGIIDEISDGTAVVDVNGLGMEVGISPGTASRMGAVGDEVKLYTYTYLREDQIGLYGFLSRDELKLFKQLITVSGIGPKAGLSLLSAMSADELRFAIASGDVGAISKAQGVGKRTAERLVLELRDKMTDAELSAAVSGNGADTAGSSPAGGISGDAVEALVALGYPRPDAMKAVKKAEAAGASDTEAILKSALTFMF
ncbi:MAG: Holliday junction branch migration protein RuvA [Lachnospiraceae bacterium]|jgi:Holliday junction DNA helicase RuvA|nr:Holliday junction branch migration protein RuvA [Lachnospiraceae bacterium]